MGDPQDTMGFNTQSWSNDLNDWGAPRHTMWEGNDGKELDPPAKKNNSLVNQNSSMEN